MIFVMRPTKRINSLFTVLYTIWFQAPKYFHVIVREDECSNFMCYHQIKSESATHVGWTVCFSLLLFKWVHTSTFTVSNPDQREPLTWASKKMCNNPGLGVSRPATSVIANFFQGKTMTNKAPSMFLFSPHHVRKNWCLTIRATNYPQREKQHTADNRMWGIQPWLCGSHWLVWISVNLTTLSTKVAKQCSYWCNAGTFRKNSSTAIFAVFHFSF